MNTKILLVTKVDEARRQLLLESQGYSVVKVDADGAEDRLRADEYQLVLVPTDNGVIPTVDLCVKVKTIFPAVRVAVIAQRAEYIPTSGCVDAIIREQHSPGRFLAAIKKLLEDGQSDDRSLSASDAP